jgi:hypothetical protein
MESSLAAAVFSAMIPVTNLDNVTTVQVDAYCVNTQSLYQIITEHGEKPMLTAISVRMIRDSEVPFATVLYVNSETKSWTLVEKIRDDVYCVVGMGDNIKPYTK